MSRQGSNNGTGSNRRVVAVLGPTNTGKTHTAVERMLGHATGMIGLPLRLLAREVYDRVVAIKGPTRVALITGEEKIVPDNPAYYVCTAESMPLEKDVGFLAVDEVQMAADNQRGHIFTDRILRARGLNETMLMGSDTIRPLIRKLLPDAEIISRPRFSELTYVKPKKLSRLPRRTAIVAFTAHDVYAVAELLRRQKGGAAIVMGALSPRTRNAQVELYQSGEVDYLVATDAIGMGLNMDIDHVAFAGTRKFDGKVQRSLIPAELAQIAGRAGRHMNAGSFSTVTGGGGNGGNGGGDAGGLDPLTVAQIEDHTFEPLKILMWRNPKLDFTSLRDLTRSLDASPKRGGLTRAPMAVDQTILKTLSANAEIAALATGRENVNRLWDACQIPDFRKISPDEHARLVARIFRYRVDGEGQLPHDWIARQVSHLDNVDGDIETLAGRIAGVRIWTYVAHRHGWLAERQHWAHVTRALEDKLSDALHQKLMQRFVDRRTAVLMRELRQKGDLLVTVENDDTVSVEGHDIGLLKGFSFFADSGADADARKLLNNAAGRALDSHVNSRVAAFLKAEDGAVSLQKGRTASDMEIVWEGAAIAYLKKGTSPLRPEVELLRHSLLSGVAAEKVKVRLREWLTRHIDETLAPLAAIEVELNSQSPSGNKPAADTSSNDPAPLTGLARGIAFRLLERFGILLRSEIDADLRQIDQDARKGLRRFGVRIGAGSLYIPLLLKPKPTQLRLALWALYEGPVALPAAPTPGMVWLEMEQGAPASFYTLAGFRPAGSKAVRVDMLERLADEVRPRGAANAIFETTPEIMGLVGLSGDDFIAVMKSIGYRRAASPEIPAPKIPAPELETAEIKASEIRASEKLGTATPADSRTDTDKAKAEPLYFRWRQENRKAADVGKRRSPSSSQIRGRAAGGATDKKPQTRKAKRQSFTDKTKRSSHDSGQNHRKQKSPQRQPRQPERAPDPHSPFAALQVLRDELKNREKAEKAKSG